MSKPRQQRVDLGGYFALKIGTPGAFGDIYYHLMEIGWPAFFGLATGFYLLVNIAFGCVYAAFPGAIANMPPHSIEEGFFFSVETIATVGYGEMAPATRLGHLIVLGEILTGLFLTAALTGLVFARFARPRDTLRFSEVAVIGEHLGVRSLMIRVVSARARPLAEVEAQLVLIDRRPLAGGRVFGRFVELPLLRARNPMLALSWTLVSPVEPGGALERALNEDSTSSVIVSVSGLDTLLAARSFGGRTYRRADFREGHDFVDMLEPQADGSLVMDMRRLSLVAPMGATGVDEA